MVFPNWFKIAWWILLLGALTSLLLSRLAGLLHGSATIFDAVVFVIWICLVLIPVFAEIKILGFEFKQKIEELKRHIDQQVVALRSDIQTHVDLRSQINPQFNIMSPPSDAQLPRIEESIRQALKTELSAFGEKLTPLKPSEELADGDALYLFGVRPSTGPGKSV
jgi:hypothetical protein